MAAMKIQGGRMVLAGGNDALKTQNPKLEKLLKEFQRMDPSNELRNVAVQTNDQELYQAISLLSQAFEIIRRKTLQSRS